MPSDFVDDALDGATGEADLNRNAFVDRMDRHGSSSSASDADRRRGLEDLGVLAGELLEGLQVADGVLKLVQLNRLAEFPKTFV
ncbi:hypothetical protein [Natrinema salinisoli]|uniref:hypothetical protein n=1 Tax=Natrinema salinisoli TaxID=2878535 RepID=UPI001CF0C305|nr:hypothetical protein [Natrinema salinisoli]